MKKLLITFALASTLSAGLFSATHAASVAQLGSTFGITEVKTTETPDADTETNLTLRIGISKRLNTAIDHTKVIIQVFFYDTVNDRDTKLTDADVNYEWVTPKHDWADTNPEILSVTYVRPKGRAIADQASVGGLKYLGYRVLVYYEGKLEAAQAAPARLLQLFPPSEWLTTPASSTPMPTVTSGAPLASGDLGERGVAELPHTAPSPHRGVAWLFRGLPPFASHLAIAALAVATWVLVIVPLWRSCRSRISLNNLRRILTTVSGSTTRRLWRNKFVTKWLLPLAILLFVFLLGLWIGWHKNAISARLARGHRNVESQTSPYSTAANFVAHAMKLREQELRTVEPLREPTSSRPVTELYEKAAEQGDVHAQITLAEMYFEGRGVSKDEKKAAELYEKAAEQGDLDAQVNLGWMYQKGKGEPQDYKKAFELYEKAAAQGFAHAQVNLGTLYEQGQGVPQDYKKAVELYEKAADQGEAYAQVNLGSLYAQGKGVPQDYGKAIELYQKAADTGFVPAQVSLASIYASGIGGPRDYKKAALLAEKAAAQGSAIAQLGLAWQYENGLGVPQDLDKAVSLYQRAAEQGYVPAQTTLANMYSEGRGVTKDEKKAAELYEKAADQGDPNAETNLGWMYHEGKGVSRDYSKAVELYQKAADQGYAPGQAYLASQYAQGKGVPKDYRKAVELFHKAVNQGQSPNVFNDFAWFLATCPDQSQRNGKDAVTYANKACQLSGWKEANFIGTLAAAFAELGDFDAAMRYQKQAMATGSDYPDKQTMEKALKLYQERKPYRE